MIREAIVHYFALVVVCCLIFEAFLMAWRSLRK